jgi:hypothetical protein
MPDASRHALLAACGVLLLRLDEAGGGKVSFLTA